MLSAARQLNARCFALLVEAARADPSPQGAPALEVLSEFAAHIDARACQRAGSCPVLLVDLNFNVPECWDRVTMPMNAAGALFVQESTSPLLHEVLMHAWSLAHSLPRVANLFFGMAPQVREAIGHLTGEEIDRIAQERAVSLRPRWEDCRAFWTRLLEAATGTSEETLIDVQLHCLSLLGGEFVPVRRTG